MLDKNKIVRKHYFDLELDSFAVLVKMPNKTVKMRKSFLIVGITVGIVLGGARVGCRGG